MHATTVNAPVYDARRVVELLRLSSCFDRIPGARRTPPPPEGFVTFFDLGISMLRLSELPSPVGATFGQQHWYDSNPFTKAIGRCCYRQLRMGAVPDSLGKTLVEQLRLLPEGEEVPSARVVILGMVLHFLATGERLFLDCYVRTTDKDSAGRRVNVGRFDRDGLGVGVDWDGNRTSVIGLSSSQKF